MPECSKYKDKKKQSEKSESANFAVNDLYLIEKKNLGEREVGIMLMTKVYIIQVHLSGSYISTVISSSNYTSLPSMAATFLITCLRVGAATIWVFHLPQQRYFYSTQSSITELLLSVFQH